MTSFQVFGLQYTLSFIVYALISKWYVWPHLVKQPLHHALAVLTLFHTLRHLGMVFLVPGVVSPDLPAGFAAQVAYGDLVTVFLAILTVIALRMRWGVSIGLTWLFNIVGFIDLIGALVRGALLDVSRFLEAAWYIPTFILPLLIITHIMIFFLLLKRPSGQAGGSSSE